MSEPEIDLLDDFVFEPTAWDIAFSLGIGLDPDTDPPILDELADAMLMWAPEPTLERLTAPALARMIRTGLEQLAAREGWQQAAAAALREFDRAPQGAEVTREVIRCLAMQV